MEFSDHNEKQLVRKFQLPFPCQMSEINVVGLCNGLICLSNSKNHEKIQIFNPFTQSQKQLPESRKFKDQNFIVGLGLHPLTKEYKVVRIVYYQNVNERYPPHYICGYNYVYSQSEVQVYSAGSNEWRNIGKIPYNIDPRMSQSLFVNGRLHSCTSSARRLGSRKIISVDLTNEQFTKLPSPDNWTRIRMHLYQLTLLGDYLSAVVYPRYGNVEIWVMKEYGVRDSWSKDFEIDVSDPIPSPHMLNPSILFSSIQVLCLMKNSGILLMRDGALTFYDPESKELKNVVFEGMPKCLQVVVHVGSLISLENV